jgi:hypothetical protein
MKKTSVLLAALATTCWGVGFLDQQAVAQNNRVQVGVLACSVAPGVGLIVGSQRSLSCTFDRTNGRDETYSGTITRLGLDIGVTGEGRMVWAVFAPSQGVQSGALAGDYVGASAEASAGVGLGANALVGGFERSLGLQPVSVQGQTGVNLALGVAGLNLQASR